MVFNLPVDLTPWLTVQLLGLLLGFLLGLRFSAWGIDGLLMVSLWGLLLTANCLIAIIFKIYEGLSLGVMVRGGGSGAFCRSWQLVLQDLLDLIMLRVGQNSIVFLLVHHVPNGRYLPRAPTLPLTSRVFLLLFDFGGHERIQDIVDDHLALICHSLIFLIDGFELLRQTLPFHLVGALAASNGVECRHVVVGGHLEDWWRQGGNRRKRKRRVWQ